MFGSWKRTGMLTILLILAVFTTGCFGLFAGSTYRLNVFVLDGTTNEAIEGATVTAGTATGQTDDEGHVTFSGLSGSVTIEVTADDFDVVTRTVTMNQNRTETFRLGVDDIVDTAIAADDFNTLVAAVLVADLEDALRGAGPFTVFAPTDEAFAALDDSLLAYLLDNPNKLAQVLLYHVVEGSIWAADAIAAAPTSLTTLQGEQIDVTVDDGNVFINDAQVITPNIGASNGVIHVIDKVLIPENFDADDIVDTAITADDFNTLVTAVLAADLEDALRGTGPFTVFAPTDAAFADVPEALLAYLLDNPEKLADVLLYHVVDGRITSDDAVAAAPTSLTTLQGDAIDVTANGGVFINDAQVTMADISASNGIIHVIDTVLIPPSLEVDDIVDTAIAADDFNTLVTAVIEANLVDALRADGPFTVFAPTDAAFADVPEALLAYLLDNPDKLADVLLYHVVDGRITSDDAVAAAPTSLTTLQGDAIDVTANGVVFVNDAQVVLPDISASNGIIHVIDTVLIPPSLEVDDIVDTAIAADGFETLVEAVIAADLVATLKGEGPFTVFAPTDDAFADLPAGTLDSLLDDPDALANILKYHVVAGYFTAAEVIALDGHTLTTVQGTTVSISVNADVLINDAKVTATDIKASNGIIHVIDAVLIPDVD